MNKIMEPSNSHKLGRTAWLLPNELDPIASLYIILAPLLVSHCWSDQINIDFYQIYISVTWQCLTLDQLLPVSHLVFLFLP